jgi:WD40 repeat protein
MLTGIADAYYSAAFSHDGQRLATGSSGTEAISLWDLSSLELVLVLPKSGTVFTNVAFSPDGNVLGSTSSNARNIWRVPSWAEIEKAEAAERAGEGR